MTTTPQLTRPSSNLPKIWLQVLIAVWALTLLTAAVTAATPPLAGTATELLHLRLTAATNPPPSIARAVAIATHNIPAIGWPLLLPFLNLRATPARTIAHLAVATTTAANAILVGAAVGVYQTPLLAFTPQLPLEWAALALAPAGWIAARDAHDRRLLARTAAAMTTLLTAAAACETWLVPHR
jgi:hypothetical protein